MNPYKLKTIINKNFKPIRFSRSGRHHYQIFLEITSEDPADLDLVDRVEYTLHPTFKHRVRSSSDRRNNFQIEIKAWGTFVVRIEVFLRDGTTTEFMQGMKENWVESYL